MAPASDMTFKEQMDGFPWSQILVVSLVRLAEPIAFSSMFTYVYFMVDDFGIAGSKAEVAKYAGFLASSFALCQVITAALWGKFADKFGRKPALVLGLLGSITATLLFGFSETYFMALMSRSLMGTLNGNVAVVRTVIGEVAKEKRHQGLAFSVIPLIWNLGCVIGPLIGGYLSGKSTSIGFMKSFVERFPYARPNILIAGLLFLSLCVAVLFLEDTHWQYKTRHDYFLEAGDKLLYKLFGKIPPHRPWTVSYDLMQEDTVPLRDLSTTDTDDLEDSPAPPKGSEDTHVNTTHLLNGDMETPASSISEILTPAVVASLSSMFVVSVHTVVAEEFLPIFLSTEVARNEDSSLKSSFPFKVLGGLGLSSSETGMILSTTGLSSVFFIILMLPHVNRKMSTLTIYNVFSIPIPFFYIIIPYVVLLADHVMEAKMVVYFLNAVRVMCLNLLLPQLNLIVHVCAPSRDRGFVNGIAISSSSAARCIGPFIWGFIMSFGQRHGLVWLAWWTLVGLAVWCIYSGKTLKDSDDDNVLTGEEPVHDD
ncbi:CYFA0S02e05908g1_1 [Cyberlindnera fabianii]|uniref:CYFA0S02e05908g1_1 n=1 Tax=Cyberlindnera fabianii TaxID=36022 RepID=A0A061ANR9_CYBFA|nr:CYFA0S02e05908g1_1 [Cyberlindnera fabianii]